MKTKSFKETNQVPELPANWEDCTVGQLRWLSENGSYGQRMIANRYLRELETARPA